MKGSETRMTAFMEGADKRYIIPVYQRKYDWKQENCRQLYDDLKKVISRTFYQNEDDATQYYTDKMKRKKDYGGKYNEKFLSYGNRPVEETDEESEG